MKTSYIINSNTNIENKISIASLSITKKKEEVFGDKDDFEDITIDRDGTFIFYVEITGVLMNRTWVSKSTFEYNISTSSDSPITKITNKTFEDGSINIGQDG
jgi:hypothetical protein